jgi:ectoine hydroxylase-related dioxygenase (phytanoyl-CoA dioxygenase family)
MFYSLANDGFEIVPSVLDGLQVEALRSKLKSLDIAPGHRNLMARVPDIAQLAKSPKILNLLKSMSGKNPFPVRSIFFDKTPETNWLVPWHQDLSIAVKKRLERSGYGPWSIKDDVPHVQPPVKILESMVTIRLHLDDCDETSGALRVIPNSHHRGRLSAAQIAEARAQQHDVPCYVKAGDALIMRPLLLHTSSEAQAPHHRRVIHLEYATCNLADGLEWENPAVEL